MLQIQSTLTNEPAACTMMQGIVGADGVRRGAIADVDLFAAFSVEIDNKGNDLWTVRERRDRTVINRKASKKVKEYRTAEQLRQDYEAAIALSLEAGLTEDDFISPIEYE